MPPTKLGRLEFWTDSPALASSYALRNADNGMNGATVSFADINPERPFVLDMGGRTFDEVGQRDLPEMLHYLVSRGEIKTSELANALAHNHPDLYDALIVRNVRDSLDNSFPPVTVAVPLRGSWHR